MDRPLQDEAQRLAQDMARDLAAEQVAEDGAAQGIDVAALEARYKDADAETFLRAMVEEHFPGQIALVSSFGAEAAVLLDLIARVNKNVPVLFIDTGMHFFQTIQYRDQVVEQLGLTDVRSLTPAPEDLKKEDPDESLWQWDTDQCCHIRKVRPLSAALEGFEAWVNGRKQMHGGQRVRLPRLEVNGSHIKVNPLAWWSREDVTRAFEASGLPPHPLVEQGYPSIGCWPCTKAAENPEDVRSGRWSGSDKTECGIHGALVRAEA